MSCSLISQVSTCQNLLTALLQSRESTSKDQMEKLFLFALIWSVGALLSNKDRKAFSGMVSISLFYFLYKIFEIRNRGLRETKLFGEKNQCLEFRILFCFLRVFIVCFLDFLKKVAGNSFPNIPNVEDSLYEVTF